MFKAVKSATATESEHKPKTKESLDGRNDPIHKKFFIKKAGKIIPQCFHPKWMQFTKVTPSGLATTVDIRHRICAQSSRNYEFGTHRFFGHYADTYLLR
ncbi:MAG: hypothetical protein HC862_13125 [Scytonema sp. RU_4_4]|nr:hypothetical protein [Scytonema sp. RU_4_4]